MKKTLYIAPLIFIFLVSSCKYFKKDEVLVTDIDTLSYVDTFEVDTTPVIPMDKDIYLLSEVNDKYMIIVGSFQTREFAKIHADKYSRLDLNTKVIAKPDGFYMVSGKSFETKEQAKKELPRFREKIAKKSWVFTNERVVDQAQI